MKPNLAGSIYVRSSIKFLRFVPFDQQIWLPRAILVSDWLMLNKSSPLKLLGQMEPNLAGSIYVRYSIKLLHMVPFGQQTWPPRAILFSDWRLLKQSSPLKLLGQMESNLAGSIYVRSSIKFLCFIPFGQQIWLPRAILFSDWRLLKQSSPLKLLGQMEPSLAGSIYVRSSIKLLRFILFFQQIWLPRAILVSDWLMLNKSSPLKLLGQIKLNLAGSIYARSSIKHLHLVPFGQQIWPPRAILFSDWLMLKKSSPLKLLGQMEPNLAGSIYVRSSIKFLHFVLFGQQIWLPRAILVSDWLLLKKSSPLKLLGQMEPNLAGSIYVRSSIKLLRFVPFGQQIWLPRAILVSDWLMLNKSSPLKLLGQMEPNLAGSIYVRYSIKLLHMVPFGQQTWPPRAILFSDWLL